MKHGKKYQDSVKAFDLAKQYEAEEAVSVILDTAKAKFDETIEMHVRLGVDPRQADQQVRGVLVLPHGTGKTKMPDLNCTSLESAMSMVAGTARSMGVTVED